MTTPREQAEARAKKLYPSHILSNQVAVGASRKAYIKGTTDMIAQIKTDINKMLNDKEADKNLIFDIVNYLKNLDK